MFLKFFLASTIAVLILVTISNNALAKSKNKGGSSDSQYHLTLGLGLDNAAGNEEFENNANKVGLLAGVSLRRIIPSDRYAYGFGISATTAEHDKEIGNGKYKPTLINLEALFFPSNESIKSYLLLSAGQANDKLVENENYMTFGLGAGAFAALPGAEVSPTLGFEAKYLMAQGSDNKTGFWQFFGTLGVLF